MNALQDEIFLIKLPRESPMVIKLRAENSRLEFMSQVPNLDNLDILKWSDV